MTTGQVVNTMILLMAGLTVFMMIMILWISRLEVRNSRNNLSMKLILHYDAKFHNMLMVMEKYQIKEHLTAVQLYNRYHSDFNGIIMELSDHFSNYCANNDFVFVSKKLSVQLREHSKLLIDTFQDFTDIVIRMDKAFEIRRQQDIDEAYFESLWEDYFLKYDKMKAILIDMKHVLNNDSILEVLNEAV